MICVVIIFYSTCALSSVSNDNRQVFSRCRGRVVFLYVLWLLPANADVAVAIATMLRRQAGMPSTTMHPFIHHDGAFSYRIRSCHSLSRRCILSLLYIFLHIQRYIFVCFIFVCFCFSFFLRLCVWELSLRRRWAVGDKRWIWSVRFIH